MSASEFRAEARSRLTGKWGKAALISLAYALIAFALSVIEGFFKEGTFMYSVVSIAIAIIEVPLTLGLAMAFLKLYKGEEVKAFDFFSYGFSNFKRAWSIAWHVFLKMIVPVICLIVINVALVFSLGVSIFAAAYSRSASTMPSFITLLLSLANVAVTVWIVCKGLYYAIVYTIAADNESLSGKEVVERSKELMTGNRGKLFCLELSFIGWLILGALAFGIGLLWVAPYMQFAVFAFYFYLSGKKSNVAEPAVDNLPKNDNEGPIQEQ